MINQLLGYGMLRMWDRSMSMRYKLIDGLTITTEPNERCSSLRCNNKRQCNWSITTNIHICEQPTIELLFGILKQLRVNWTRLGLHDRWYALNKINLKGFDLDAFPVLWNEYLDALRLQQLHNSGFLGKIRVHM